ncbi:MAG: hypothetical protein GC191_11810 [Azospirillum sp.]|nr:hypothetical protein [Azospirillum sp.]
MYCRDRHSCEVLYSTRINESVQRLDRLLRTAPQVASEIRIEFERALDELRGRLNRAMAKVEASRRASDGAWDFARRHADAAFQALSEAFDQFETRFSLALAA